MVRTAATCNCSPTAEETHAGVTITGHQLATCLQGEPRQYAWKESATLHVGTLADYANTWEQVRYEHNPDELSAEVLVWGDVPAVHKVDVTWDRTSRDDVRWYRLVVGNEACVVPVDGKLL